MDKEKHHGAENGQQGPPSIHPRLKVQIAGTESFFGPGVRTLLLHIRAEGSVREACEKMGLSYSKGRKILERAEKELGYVIVERAPGGKNGGSARLSEAGQTFLAKYEQFERELCHMAEERFEQIFGK